MTLQERLSHIQEFIFPDDRERFFAMLYAAFFKMRIKRLLKNAEFRFYSALIVLSTVVIVYFLLQYNHYSVGDAIRCALFQVVSFITTTGMFNEDAAQWHHITWVVLSLCMFFGGCAGSTASGFKCARGVIALKILRNEVRRMVHPKALLPVKVNNTSVHSPSQITLLAFFIAYITLCFTAYFNPALLLRLLRHDSCRGRQHQLVYHCPELCQQRGAHPGTRNRPDHVVERVADDGQVDSLGPDADGKA